MPIEKYFKGRGEEVAREMRKRYGKRWKRIFYATANKMGLVPEGRMERWERILAGLEEPRTSGKRGG